VSTENENIEPTQDEIAGAQETTAFEEQPTEGAPSLEEQVEGAMKNVDPEKLAALRAALKKMATTDKKTLSGSEAPPEEAVTEEGEGAVNDGSKVDWSEYDLQSHLRHLYPRAMYRETPQGPAWVVMLDEFYSTDCEFRGHGKTAKDQRVNLGEFLSDMTNGPEGWRPVSILPSSIGRAGVLLSRQVPQALPEPVRLKKETEVEPPRDPELKQVEDAGLKFAQEETLEFSAPADPDTFPPMIVQQALELNGPADRDPATAKPAMAPMDAEAGAAAEAALAGEDFEKAYNEDGTVQE
jgi:hypothetical protein